ncbi:MAG TPA: hypothetical protein VLK33_22915 [Terriglobales bacterium]|nr:hypothetical protein [Terriglobales bacterium]
MTNLALNDLKPLTLDQYDQCRTRALERVQKRIGDKPTREQFTRELGALWTILDIIALVVFLPALAVSSIHIIAHMGHLAESSYQATVQAGAGTILSRDLYVAVHQWALIPLAEGSMILFLVMFGMGAGWRRWVSFALALLAGVFVLVANWQSGIGVLESLLAPAFTIGIGLKLEHLIVQTIARRQQVDTNYLEALSIYEAATVDPAQHPDFQPMFRQALWEKLSSLKANEDFRDAPTGFKHQAVKRELGREAWAYEEAAPVSEFVPLEEVSKAPTDNPFGSTALDLEPAGPASISMNGRANGHGKESMTVN